MNNVSSTSDYHTKYLKTQKASDVGYPLKALKMDFYLCIYNTLQQS